jgi:hypothetical protein
VIESWTILLSENPNEERTIRRMEALRQEYANLLIELAELYQVSVSKLRSRR